MKIAKIVSSNSHIDYVARIIDALDVETPPKPEDHGFGEFVSIDVGSEKIVGIIYDSRLINPEYANFGPRLEPSPPAGNFTPDFINEQGILIGIILLGSFAADGGVHCGIPRRIVPPGVDVEKMDDSDVAKFHTDADGSVRLHYYSQIVTNAGSFAVPLLESVIGRVGESFSDNERTRLSVLKNTLVRNRTIGTRQFQ